MNLYVRYFDQDALAHSVEEVGDFLSSIPEIQVTSELLADIQDYADSSMPYPKRYKIRPRVYFILIKTAAETMEEFKEHKRDLPQKVEIPQGDRKEMKVNRLLEMESGWYRGEIIFKRVMLIPGTNKFQYQDTRFSAFVKAECGQHCYDRIVDHLKNRQDVDLRSQFPSAKGSNFSFEYLGKELSPN